MSVSTRGIVRPVEAADRAILADLLRATSLIHRHLDWRPPLDWLKFQPFLVYEDSGRIQACLACPIHPAPVAWLRLFMAYSPRLLETAWQVLWDEGLDFLVKNRAQKIAALPIDSWLKRLLERHGFHRSNSVVSLIWKAQLALPGVGVQGCSVRAARPEDLERIAEVDAAAFERLWQQPLEDLELAFEQAAVATVIEKGKVISGYTICTGSTLGGHLARLAVHPDLQHQGLGRMLLVDLLSRFQRRGARWLTVNTQDDNAASLALYNWAGFRLTGETYPVYELEF